MQILSFFSFVHNSLHPPLCLETSRVVSSFIMNSREPSAERFIHSVESFSSFLFCFSLPSSALSFRFCTTSQLYTLAMATSIVCAHYEHVNGHPEGGGGGGVDERDGKG